MPVHTPVAPVHARLDPRASSPHDATSYLTLARPRSLDSVPPNTTMYRTLTAIFATTLLLCAHAAPACVTGRGDGLFSLNAGGDSNKALAFGADNPSYIVGPVGHVHSTVEKIYTPPGSALSPIYSSERYTRGNKLVYSIPVPAGDYSVTTLHAEIYHNAAGKRKFHIEINGNRKRTNLDVFADANGKNKGIKLCHHNIKPVNGMIEVAFLKSVENPQVNGIIVKGKGAGEIASGCCGGKCPRSLPPKGKTSNKVMPDIIDITAKPKPLRSEEMHSKSKSAAPQPSAAPTPEAKKHAPEVVDIPVAPAPLTSAEMKPATAAVHSPAAPKPTPSSEPVVAVTKAPSADPTPSMVTAIPIPSKAGETSTGTMSSSGGCGSGKYIFCEDFDDLSLGKTERTGKWTLDGKASIAISPVRKSKALYLDPSGAGGEKGRLMVRNGISAPGNSMFGRMRVWVKEFATAPPYAHWVIAEMYQADSSGEPVPGTERVRPVGGQFIPGQGSLWGIGSDGGPTGDWTQHRETAPTVDGKWICVEWSMVAKNSEIKFWIDGTLKPEMTVDVDQHDGGHGKFMFPKMDSAWFGWWLFQGDAKPAKFDVYLDDIALAETRIGC